MKKEGPWGETEESKLRTNKGEEEKKGKLERLVSPPCRTLKRELRLTQSVRKIIIINPPSSEMSLNLDALSRRSYPQPKELRRRL